VQRFVDRPEGLRLWAEELPSPDPAAGEPLLLVAPANQSGVVWPTALLGPLNRRHRLLRYDHRDTGRSGLSEDPGYYGVRELADDAVAVLDAFDVDRAHLVGMGLGGLIAQLLLLDHAPRLRTATLVGTTALTAPGDPPLPGPDPALRRLWAEHDDPRDDDGELDWRVEHWRLLNGTGSPFDAEEFRALEQRVIAHSGRPDPATAHSELDDAGLDRGAELAGVTVPTLVVEAPDDPVHPPEHARHLAAAIPGARLVTVPGMGHALNRVIAEPLAAAILAHTCG
jgi:pimeloyl-ACP methyl ester carboxylesterase